MAPAQLLALVIIGAAAGTAGAILASNRRPPQPPVERAEAPVEPSPTNEPAADWCAPGYEPIGGGCLALATSAPAPQPLLVYLHGRYARDVASEEVDRQQRLGATATARGFAVLALRGRLGQCSSADLAEWFCWPSNEQNQDRAAAVIATWAAALEEAHRRARSKTRFVLGFSNGAYFATLLATRGIFQAAGFVIAHGGPVEPVRAPTDPAPLLLLSADDDIAQDDMIRLDGELTREHWPHDSYARGGAHGLTNGDIDAALTFFARVHEALPLDPPLPLHRPIHHVHEAGTADAEPAAEPVAEPIAPPAAEASGEDLTKPPSEPEQL